MLDFGQVVCNLESIMAELGYNRLEQSSGLYEQNKQLANIIFDRLKPDCEKFIGVLEGTQEVVSDEYLNVMCFPRRFLKTASTSALPSSQRVPIEDKLEKTFLLGLVSYWFSITFPTRSDCVHVDLNTHIPIWLRDALIADRKLDAWSREFGGQSEMLFGRLYNGEVEPMLKNEFKAGFLKRGIYRSYFRNIFYAGVLLGLSIDLATTSTADTVKMKNINIEELKIQFRGRQFSQLIKHHLKKQNKQQLYDGVLGTKALLPQSVQSLATYFIDRWNGRVYEKEFWHMDASEVFSSIIEDARSVLMSAGAPTDDETLFNLFQIVILNYACSASDQPNMRKFIGI